LQELKENKTEQEESNRSVTRSHGKRAVTERNVFFYIEHEKIHSIFFICAFIKPYMAY
jgi:hypothetical protein